MKRKKTNKILRVLQGLFKRAQSKVKVKHVQDIVASLKKRERTIKKRLESEKSKSKIKQLTNELDVIEAQRQKGKVLLKNLQEKKK